MRIDALRESKLVRWVASEERPEILEIEDAKYDFGVTLDGSSLIPVNLAVGTIVGIYPGSVLQPGEKMISAMYFYLRSTEHSPYRLLVGFMTLSLTTTTSSYSRRRTSQSRMARYTHRELFERTGFYNTRSISHNLKRRDINYATVDLSQQTYTRYCTKADSSHTQHTKAKK